MFTDTSRPSTQFLQKQPWFSQLPMEMQEHVADRTFTLAGLKGDVLLHAGVEVKGWYAVLSGLVKLQSTSSQGRLSAFIGVPDGEWFGEGSTLKAEQRRYDVIALRDSVLLCLPCAQFAELFATSLPFNHFLVAHMNRRLGQAMTIIEAGRLRAPEQRVALYLSRVFWSGRRKLDLSQEELGHLAGLSRQTVNRALKSMAQEGLVSLEFGRVTILNEQALAAYADRAAVQDLPPQAQGDEPDATIEA
ncbi:MAG TPA: Crp/Fnr family transcriptional regulator [Polaromonas sp.]|uniref:Crp/Fnr family transcriptional regulator n=1 Tax=Polaromonas sp. TaxID=1869339 RepID=UPI002D2FB395|nr:Crp/Fnr family transcriptional regulator [Polaromonas sp.]HYW58732.1 Crp/Fnr family transcriptional regulator [Polaromonas sp.]